jgi:alkaline phosphatase isozyme conversion protein
MFDRNLEAVLIKVSMKTHLHGILLVLIFVMSACQPSTHEPASPLTSLSPKFETPTVVLPQATSTLTIPPTPTETEIPAGEIAYAHVKAISEGIGPRVAGSVKEAKTAQYLILVFEHLGYVSELRPFRVTVRARVIDSANVIAVKPGASPMEIIVGAHYDSVKVGKGADDNASGVGVILEVAERLRAQETPYTIRFLLFGAEEAGMQGSKYYVSQMTPEQIQNTVAMINLDSLTAGDFTYVYGDQGERGAIRDWALNFVQTHGLELQTQLGENPKYPRGTTGDWSDQAPFKGAAIPYAYFESTNWTLEAKDGYTQVDPAFGENGEIWHTKYDTLDYINSTFPGRMQKRLDLFVTVLQAVLTEFEGAK